MWMKKGYLYFVIFCSILEDCEIFTNSPPNSSLLEQNELQHRKERIDGESRSQSKRRIIVHKSHLLCPLKDIVNNPTTKKTTPLSSNKQASDGLGDIKRIRRNVDPSRKTGSLGNDNSTLNHPSSMNGTDKWPDNITSATPQQPPTETPTIPTPPRPLLTPWQLSRLSNEDANITMHCESYWFSCRGRCTRERKLGGTEERSQCFCDNSCELFKDCCADFDQYCSSSAQQTKNPEHNRLWTCVKSKSFDNRGVWMISSCPRNWTQDDIKARCSKHAFISYDNLKEALPVIDRKGNTYKNHHCAQCNGLNLTDIIFYKIQFSCDVLMPKEYNRSEILKFLFTFCNDPHWQPPTGVKRRYCYRVLSNLHCDDSSLPTKVQQKCLNGSLRLVYEKVALIPRIFFNPYCALCSYVNKVGCGPGPIPSEEKSLSLVSLDLDHPGSETAKIRRLKVTCLDGNVYDFYLKVCRPGIRPSDVTSVREQIYSVSVWMHSNISNISGHWSPPLTKINFKEAIANKLNIKETLFSVIVIGNPWGPVSTVVFNINIGRTVPTNISIETLQTTMSSISIVLNDENYTIFKVLFKFFDCPVFEIFNPHEYTFEGNAVKIMDTGEIFQVADYYSNETEWINGSLVPIGILTVCKPTQLNCSGILVRLAEDKYVILSNGSLYRNISRELFETTRFTLVNDTILVCEDFIPLTIKPGLWFLLTYIGLSLSIISLVSVLVTYSLFKELRTLPGINLMNLSLAHLLSNLLFLGAVYVEAKVVCTVIAILLHYFLLVSFMWMSIIAFETWQGLYIALAFVFTSRVKQMYRTLLCIKSNSVARQENPNVLRPENKLSPPIIPLRPINNEA
ncbi:hypothetical protein OS493_024890 [Desmophyllum pertusum]|uniref:Uncharacterized protein n=1 Tax=Desmophyllum pertusum TaxID=174260 RepID=A0A9X0CS78_9CNID|nr:hypothetical protein OS493_024890 [Desmophyllum pertusum]